MHGRGGVCEIVTYNILRLECAVRGVAQLAARMHGVHEVPGSSPGTPTI